MTWAGCEQKCLLWCDGTVEPKLLLLLAILNYCSFYICENIDVMNMTVVNGEGVCSVSIKHRQKIGEILNSSAR